MNTAAIVAVITAGATLITALTALVIAVNKLRNSIAKDSPNAPKPSFMSGLKALFGPVSTPL